MAQHLELELAVPVNKLGIGKKVKPIVTGSLKEPRSWFFRKARRSSIFCES